MSAPALPPGWRCDNCGLLERAEGGEGPPSEPCPQCGGVDWNELTFAQDLRALLARAEQAEVRAKELEEAMTAKKPARKAWHALQIEDAIRDLEALERAILAGDSPLVYNLLIDLRAALRGPPMTAKKPARKRCGLCGIGEADGVGPDGFYRVVSVALSDGVKEVPGLLCGGCGTLTLDFKRGLVLFLVAHPAAKPRGKP